MKTLFIIQLIIYIKTERTLLEPDLNKKFLLIKKFNFTFFKP